MNEYIERQAAQAVLCDACGNAACPKGLIPTCSYYKRMQDIPAADVRPVVKGEWLKIKQESIYQLPTFYYVYSCSICGHRPAERLTNFCPNCGADMKGE